MIQISGLRSFVRRTNYCRKRLEEIRDSKTPDAAYDLKLALQYSYAKVDAAISYLRAVEGIRDSAKVCARIRTVVFGNYNFNNVRFLVDDFSKTGSSVSIRDVEKFIARFDALESRVRAAGAAA